MYVLQEGDTNKRGFLSDPEQWDSDVAEALASAEGVDLTVTHWVVLKTIRTLYEQSEAPTSYHVLCQELGDTLVPFKYGCMHALKQLFPGGGIKQAARISGVPDHFCFGC
jgi:tRNA 2-thiouridine synthesizing protein E